MNRKQKQGLAYFILIEIAMIIGVARTITILYNIPLWRTLIASSIIASIITLFWILHFKNKNEKTNKGKRKSK
jgi:uncharacterized protein (DUF983 family)